ncbi:MAG: hypothetical protein BalsKO_06360 [Balneolaceae bacterium]
MGNRVRTGDTKNGNQVKYGGGSITWDQEPMGEKNWYSAKWEEESQVNLMFFWGSTKGNHYLW